jgi:hypothetical protein
MANGNLRGMQLKDRITDILRGDGKSISEIYKEVNMEEESKIHRLSLTGYLWAMADFGVLKEKYQKPSKLYFMNKREDTTIYDTVRIKLSQEPDEKRGPQTLYLLYKIFDRPIFRSELEKAGVTWDVKGKKLDKKERKKLLEKLDAKELRLTADSDAYIPNEEFPELALRIATEIVVEKFDLRREKAGVQKKLENIL